MIRASFIWHLLKTLNSSGVVATSSVVTRLGSRAPGRVAWITTRPTVAISIPTSCRAHATAGTRPASAWVPIRRAHVLVPDALYVHTRPCLSSAPSLLGRRLTPVSRLRSRVLATSANALLLPVTAGQGPLPEVPFPLVIQGAIPRQGGPRTDGRGPRREPPAVPDAATAQGGFRPASVILLPRAWTGIPVLHLVDVRLENSSFLNRVLRLLGVPVPIRTLLKTVPVRGGARTTGSGGGTLVRKLRMRSRVPVATATEASALRAVRGRTVPDSAERVSGWMVRYLASFNSSTVHTSQVICGSSSQRFKNSGGSRWHRSQGRTWHSGSSSPT